MLIGVAGCDVPSSCGVDVGVGSMLTFTVVVFCGGSFSSFAVLMVCGGS